MNCLTPHRLLRLPTSSEWSRNDRVEETFIEAEWSRNDRVEGILAEWAFNNTRGG